MSEYRQCECPYHDDGDGFIGGGNCPNEGRINPAKEYRIEDGNVEVRTLDPEGGSPGRTRSVWWRLTPEQLSIHVERNTVVAQWLERRLGWRRLLQACVGQEPFLLTKMLQVPLMTVCRFRFSLIEIASVSGVPIWLANFDSRTGIAVPDLPLFLASKQQYSNSPKMA